MSKSNVLENQQEIGSHAQIFVYRIPKKNHDAIVQLNKQIKDILPKDGPLHSEFFYLSSTESIMNFLNITEIVSANQDEEVWVEIQSARIAIRRWQAWKKIRTVNHFTNNIYLLSPLDLVLL